MICFRKEKLSFVVDAVGRLVRFCGGWKSDWFHWVWFIEIILRSVDIVLNWMSRFGSNGMLSPAWESDETGTPDRILFGYTTLLTDVVVLTCCRHSLPAHIIPAAALQTTTAALDHRLHSRWIRTLYAVYNPYRCAGTLARKSFLSFPFLSVLLSLSFSHFPLHQHTITLHVFYMFNFFLALLADRWPISVKCGDRILDFIHPAGCVCGGQCF